MRQAIAFVLTMLALVACSQGQREPRATVPAAQASPAAPTDSAPSTPSTTQPGYSLALGGHARVSYDCSSDSDCTIKDIGNCCGAYPSCVNVGSTPDPEAVARECAAKGLAGICGYPVISACECRAGRCEASNDSIGEGADR